MAIPTMSAHLMTPEDFFLAGSAAVGAGSISFIKSYKKIITWRTRCEGRCTRYDRDSSSADGSGHRFHHPFVERAGHDTGRRRLSNEGHQIFGASDEHLVGNLFDPVIERPAENPRKAQRVVDLIGKIRTPGAYHSGPSSLGNIRHDFRHRVGQRKNHRFFGHTPNMRRRKNAGFGNANKHVSSLESHTQIS